MARLHTGGAEVDVDAGHLQGLIEYGSGGPGGGTYTRDTVVFRSGLASTKFDSTVANTAASLFAVNQATGITFGAISTSYWYRVYMRFDAAPASTVPVVNYNNGAGISARLTSGGKLQLFNDATGLQVGSDSAATLLMDGSAWYRIELLITTDASGLISASELQLDGVSVATVTGITIANNVSRFICGWIAAPGANKICYADDTAVNDSTGTVQNSWPGSGKVVVLKPTADSAVGTGWTKGNAGAAPLFQNLDNTPPDSATDLTANADTMQIRNATANANVNYDATMTTYAAAGITATDTVNLVLPLVLTGAPVTTGAKAGTVGVVSNPRIANVSLSAFAGSTAGAFWAGAAVGTYPTGTKLSPGTTTYAPTVTLGTAPVMRVTQVTSSTRIAIVAEMFIFVDYTPATPAEPTDLMMPQLMGVFVK